MTASPLPNPAITVAAATRMLCPQCGIRLKRVQRHWLDRLISLFVPLERVRCTSKLCGWEGVVRHGSLGRFGRSLAKYYPVDVIDAAHPRGRSEARLREAGPPSRE